MKFENIVAAAVVDENKQGLDCCTDTDDVDCCGPMVDKMDYYLKKIV